MVCDSEAQKSLFLLFGNGNTQIIPVSTFRGVSVEAIQKKSGKVVEEGLKAGSTLYRFNGILWTPFFEDLPFPYLEKIKYDANESWLILKNLGSYTTRFILTIAFPEIKDLQKIKLTRDIKTVKLYPAGSWVHHKQKGKIALPYTMIEVIKEPFGKGKKIRLPFFMENPNTKILLRGVFSFRGGIESWPQTQFNESIIQDAQGYFAFSLLANQHE
ncbi:MAG: hypothetical protein D6767_01545 [Candidatus Hydrogenedentota bacterium]|nr:MAG: hypothetical protein D6767_01545 [Candidatus Hydrogenedentota bacterium]